MNKQPLVSVLMTVYNREKYIAEAIESVMASTYENWELIITDDQSSDDSLIIAQKYAAEDDRIKVYLNENNLGDYPNRNKAASYAQGKYLKYLDSDDLIYPHGLEVMVRAMEKFPNAGIGLTHYFNSQMPLPIQLKSKQVTLIHFNKNILLTDGPTGCMYQRKCFEKLGGFNPDFRVASDYEFNMRASLFKPIVLFNPGLSFWRQHEEQEFQKNKVNDDYLVFNYLIHQSHIDNSFISDDFKTEIIKNDQILMARRLIKLLANFQITRLIKVLKRINENITFLLKGFLKTKRPKNLSSEQLKY